MSKITDGNDPIAPIIPHDNSHEPMYGLTVREYFAAMAMQGLFSNHKFMQDATIAGKKIDFIAEKAVQASDLLITALNNP